MLGGRVPVRVHDMPGRNVRFEKGGAGHVRRDAWATPGRGGALPGRAAMQHGGMSTDEVKVEDGATAPDVDVDALDDSADVAAAKTKRPKPRRMRDMAMSLAVLLVPLGLFFGGWQWLAADRQVSVVDTTEDYATASSLGLIVIEPALADGWKPISTDIAVEGEQVTLRTGWYSPEGDGLQLIETSGAAVDVNDGVDGAGTPAEAGGITWATYELDGGAEAWVAELDAETVILTAETDGVNELPELAAAVAEAL